MITSNSPFGRASNHRSRVLRPWDHPHVALKSLLLHHRLPLHLKLRPLRTQHPMIRPQVPRKGLSPVVRSGVSRLLRFAYPHTLFSGAAEFDAQSERSCDRRKKRARSRTRVICTVSMRPTGRPKCRQISNHHRRCHWNTIQAIPWNLTRCMVKQRMSCQVRHESEAKFLIRVTDRGRLAKHSFWAIHTT